MGSCFSRLVSVMENVKAIGIPGGGRGVLSLTNVTCTVTSASVLHCVPTVFGYCHSDLIFISTLSLLSDAVEMGEKMRLF